MKLLLSFFLFFISPADPKCDGPHAVALEGAAYPLSRERISSSFGMRKDPMNGEARHHKGVDLVVAGDPEVRSIEKGLVVFAGPLGGYGILVSVLHGRGVSSHYAHLGSFFVEVGDKVERGTVIGSVGATGRTTGAHLHLEIRRNGCALDPLLLLPSLGTVGLG